ncbi:hypothetical protein BGX30_002181 [Mortierella sp. GBA39]|nr:hypothetical protein BGX30_002181 [Mortierella sp. GBA39]
MAAFLLPYQTPDSRSKRQSLQCIKLPFGSLPTTLPKSRIAYWHRMICQPYAIHAAAPEGLNLNISLMALLNLLVTFRAAQMFQHLWNIQTIEQLQMQMVFRPGPDLYL